MIVCGTDRNDERCVTYCSNRNDNGLFHYSYNNYEWWRESVIVCGIDRNDDRCVVYCSVRNDG